MKIYVNNDEGFCGCLVYSEKNKTCNEWYGNTWVVSKYNGRLMRSASLLEKGFEEYVGGDLDKWGGYACVTKMLECFYDELKLASKKTRIKYFHAYLKGYLNDNISKGYGGRIFWKGLPSFEYKVVYRILGYRLDSNGFVGLKMEDMYGDECWLEYTQVRLMI